MPIRHFGDALVIGVVDGIYVQDYLAQASLKQAEYLHREHINNMHQSDACSFLSARSDVSRQSYISAY